MRARLGHLRPLWGLAALLAAACGGPGAASLPAGFYVDGKSREMAQPG